MARGYIYNIEERTDNLGLSECTFHDRLIDLGIDYVQQQAPEEAKERLDAFAKRLVNLGLTVIPITYEDWDGNTRDGYRMETGTPEQVKAAQRKFFRLRIDELKDMVLHLDEDRFCSDQGYAQDIKSLVKDDYDDVVSSMTDEAQTMDRFIRYLEPGKTLYIGAEVILMH